MNFALSGGTSQQRQWFDDAVAAMSSFPFDSFGTNVTVSWVPESVLQAASHAFGRFTFALTTLTEPADTATIQIFNELDTRTEDQFQGKDFYMETVAHEIGHVVSGRLDEFVREEICGLFNEGLGSWEDGSWEQMVKEACSEIIKDAYQPQRKFDNRTTRFVAKENFTRLLTLLGLSGTAGEHQTLGVLGSILGDYNLGSWASVPPAPGNIYGITTSEPGQPVFVDGVPIAYDYVILANIQEAGAYYIPWWAIYPFVHFWPLLDNPRNWKLSLLIHGGHVGPFTEENPGGVLPPPGLRLAHFQFGPVNTDIFFGDLVNVVDNPFLGSYDGEYPIADADAEAIAATSMASGTPFFDYRDYGGGAGFNDNATFPFSALNMRWEWDIGAPADLPPWPYHDPDFAFGVVGQALRKKHHRIQGVAGPATSLR